MKIALIAALSRNRVIGKDNRMPWHLPADLRHFKTLTLDKPVIMGRKTFISIGKALPHRQNIIVTHDQDFSAADCQIAHTLEDALSLAYLASEIMVIGGASLFKQAMPLAKRMYLTIIQADIVGDTFFPQWDPREWQVIEQQKYPADHQNPYDLNFITLKKSS